MAAGRPAAAVVVMLVKAAMSVAAADKWAVRVAARVVEGRGHKYTGSSASRCHCMPDQCRQRRAGHTDRACRSPQNSQVTSTGYRLRLHILAVAAAARGQEGARCLVRRLGELVDGVGPWERVWAAR